MPNLITDGFNKRTAFYAYLIPVLAISPSLVWIVLDTSAWGGDQSQYGRVTLELFHALTHVPERWTRLMFGIFPWKAPGLTWLGQFFVPLGYVICSMDTALLLAVVATQAVSLMLIYRSLLNLSSSTFFVPLSACLVIASAPLFIAFAHEYLSESVQILSVAWFILVMSAAPRWNRALLLAQLSAATAFAMLSKVSQPLFCLWPGLVACFYLVRPRQAAGLVREQISRTLLSVSVAIPLVLATSAWYYHNFTPVTQHAYAAAYGPGVRELWGKEDTYLNTLAYWVQSAQTGFFLKPVWLLLLVLVVGAAISALRANRMLTHFTLCTGAAALQLATVALAFSFSVTRQPRFLLPVLPYFALLVGWSVAHLNRKAITGLVVTVFGFQLVALHGQALGLVPQISPWLRAVDRYSKSGRVLTEVIDRTCTKSGSGPSWNILAVEPTIPALQGDWLAPEPANYAVAKRRFRAGDSLPCQFGYLGEGFFGSPVPQAWDSLLARRTQYVIAVDPVLYPAPAVVANQALSRENYPEVLGKLQTSGVFEREPPLSQDPGILVFRRQDYVARGRALTDQGDHQQAAAVLRHATTLEPTNAEAWANLTLAYSRQGSVEPGIAAARRGLALNPRHYYLNFMLAQMLYARGEVSEVIPVAERALAEAPSRQDRVNTLVLMGQTYYLLKNKVDACRMLTTAHGTQPSEATALQIKTWQCSGL